MIFPLKSTKWKWITYLGRLFSFFILFLSLCTISSSQQCVQDEEAEQFFLEIMERICKVMGMECPNIYISDSMVVNASATQTGDIIINAGLIILADNVEEIIAVLAHELGHIDGKHIQIFVSSQEQFSRSGLLTTVFGALASVVAMNPAPLVFGMASGAQVSQGLALAKLRQKEAQADTISAETIRKLQWPVWNGFISVHGKFAEKPSPDNIYFSTHPSSEDRLQKFRRYYQEEKKKKFPQENIDLIKKWNDDFKRIKSKINVIVREPRLALELAPDDYSRCIALFRQGKNTESMKIVEKLLSQDPDNHYYAEIKMFNLVSLKKFDSAVKFAIPFLSKSNRKKNMRDLAIIFAQAVLLGNNAKTKSNLNLAIRYLEKLKLRYKHDIVILFILGEAYDAVGDHEHASLCTAEWYAMIGDKIHAVFHAQKAKASKIQAINLKAQDILRHCEYSPQ